MRLHCERSRCILPTFTPEAPTREVVVSRKGLDPVLCCAVGVHVGTFRYRRGTGCGPTRYNHHDAAVSFWT